MQLVPKMFLAVAFLLVSGGVVECTEDALSKMVMYATDSVWISEDQVPDEFEVLPIPNEEGLVEVRDHVHAMRHHSVA